MPKKLVIVITTMLLVSFCIPAFAYYDFSEGRPAELKPGRDSGYYIWHDRNGWHLFTTAAGMPKRFAGVIRTDGEIYNFRAENIERGQDKIRTDLKRDTISFNFRSGANVDGLSFRVKNSSYIQFDLYVDGKRVDPWLIHIGHENWHPAKSQFRIRL